MEKYADMSVKARKDHLKSIILDLDLCLMLSEKDSKFLDEMIDHLAQISKPFIDVIVQNIGTLYGHPNFSSATGRVNIYGYNPITFENPPYNDIEMKGSGIKVKYVDSNYLIETIYLSMSMCDDESVLNMWKNKMVDVIYYKENKIEGIKLELSKNEQELEHIKTLIND